MKKRIKTKKEEGMKGRGGFFISAFPEDPTSAGAGRRKERRQRKGRGRGPPWDWDEEEEKRRGGKSTRLKNEGGPRGHERGKSTMYRVSHGRRKRTHSTISEMEGGGDASYNPRKGKASYRGGFSQSSKR